MTISPPPDAEWIAKVRRAIEDAFARPLPSSDLEGDENTDADPRGYTIGYPALRDLLDRTDLANPLHVRAALYAAYGWMPKVLNADVPDELIAEVGRIALHARSLAPSDGKPVEDARLADLLDRIRTSGAMAATNNEPVGLSKFLHLAAPTVVPIWDSRIRKTLGQGQHYRGGFLRDFEAYVRALHDWRRDGNAVPSDDPANPSGTDHDDPNEWVRAAEWYLFRVGPPAG